MGPASPCRRRSPILHLGDSSLKTATGGCEETSCPSLRPILTTPFQAGPVSGSPRSVSDSLLRATSSPSCSKAKEHALRVSSPVPDLLCIERQQ
uniref:Predicted protein n=1 Tax=Hordeum vulgare subsp. vulgare TaxID=112509 RepID=F2CXV0_HORVV|nr:predicted protein [Hordeum vulgare subsp. vulgare]